MSSRCLAVLRACMDVLSHIGFVGGYNGDICLIARTKHAAQDCMEMLCGYVMILFPGL